MTHKERVLAALNHRQPDAIPIDFGGTAVTGIHVSCVAALREYYGLEKRPVKVHEPYQMLGLVEDDLKEAMGIDVEGAYAAQDHVRLPQRPLEDVADCPAASRSWSPSSSSRPRTRKATR